MALKKGTAMSKEDKREVIEETAAILEDARPTEASQAAPSPEETYERVREAIMKAGTIECGILKLSTPILARGEDVNELRYDFRRITGRQYIRALDVSAPSRDINAITSEQALELFIAATRGLNEGIDDIDIRERMGVDDVLQAVRIGKVFFGWKALAGDKRTQRM